MRLEVITTTDAFNNDSTDLYLFQSDRNYGLIVAKCTAGPCIDPADPPPPPPPPPPERSSMHLGVLMASSGNQGAKWKTTATIPVHDNNGHGSVADATVIGEWSDPGGFDTCNTGSNGQCSVNLRRINGSVSEVTFTVTNVTHTTLAYDPIKNDLESFVTAEKPQ